MTSSSKYAPLVTTPHEQTAECRVRVCVCGSNNCLADDALSIHEGDKILALRPVPRFTHCRLAMFLSD